MIQKTRLEKGRNESQWEEDKARVNGEKGMIQASAMWAGAGQHTCLAKPYTPSLTSVLSSCYVRFLNISCVTSLSTWGGGKRSQCQIRRSGCQ